MNTCKSASFRPYSFFHFQVNRVKIAIKLNYAVQYGADTSGNTVYIEGRSFSSVVLLFTKLNYIAIIRTTQYDGVYIVMTLYGNPFQRKTSVVCLPQYRKIDNGK